MINVTFTPTSTGTRSGGLNITANTASGSQSIAMAGSATPSTSPDFAFSAAPASDSVSPGGVRYLYPDTHTGKRLNRVDSNRL
jgi:hypothetical protein